MNTNSKPTVESLMELLDTHTLLQTDTYEWCCSECDWTGQGWWGEVGTPFGDHLMALIMATLLSAEDPRSGSAPEGGKAEVA